MKKAIAMIAVLGLAASPLMAAPLVTNATQQIAELSGGSRGFAGIAYNNATNAFYFASTSISQGGATFIYDDVHIPSSISSGTIQTIQWVINNPVAQSVSSTVLVFSNPGGANTQIGATLTGFLFLPFAFPAGNTFIGFNGFSLPVSPATKDLWIGFGNTSGSLVNWPFGGPVPTGTSSPNFGLGLAPTSIPTGLPVPAPSFFTVPGSMGLRVTTVPEPAAAGLLCLGGLVALRRRRRVS